MKRAKSKSFSSSKKRNKNNIVDKCIINDEEYAINDNGDLNIIKLNTEFKSVINIEEKEITFFLES